MENDHNDCIEISSKTIISYSKLVCIDSSLAAHYLRLYDAVKYFHAVHSVLLIFLRITIKLSGNQLKIDRVTFYSKSHINQISIYVIKLRKEK